MRAAGRVTHPLSNCRRVVDRRGVGHGADGGKSSSGCSHRPACDSFLMRLARLAKVNVNIDEAGRYDQTTSVDILVSLPLHLSCRRDLGHTPTAEQKIVFPFELLRGVDEVAATDAQTVVRSHAPSVIP